MTLIYKKAIDLLKTEKFIIEPEIPQNLQQPKKKQYIDTI